MNDAAPPQEVSMTTFKDYFSAQAQNYAKHRPHYPQALFRYLATLTEEHLLAWDCGTGSGQAAVALADYYQHVIATDASAEQIDKATVHKNVDYRVMPAENTHLLSESIDLITVATAMHWFNFEEFFAEVRRVLKPQGILAAWCYNLPHINPEIDEIIGAHLYKEILGSYWPPERRYIDERFQTIPFPFQPLATPNFFLENHWDLAGLINYLATWSASLLYQKQHGHAPMDEIMTELTCAWGDPLTVHAASHEIYLLVGRK
ncbi:class I SAM-dependent methyltransferase [soil metagenome]